MKQQAYRIANYYLKMQLQVRSWISKCVLWFNVYIENICRAFGTLYALLPEIVMYSLSRVFCLCFT